MASKTLLSHLAAIHAPRSRYLELEGQLSEHRTSLVSISVHIFSEIVFRDLWLVIQ